MIVDKHNKWPVFSSLCHVADETYKIYTNVSLLFRADFDYNVIKHDTGSLVVDGVELSVSEALFVHPFSEGKLLAGKNGLSRTIRWINVMDAPDADNWVKSGELLLTTAYAIHDKIELAVPLLRRLNDRQCAGLGIKTGRFWPQIPAEIIEEAESLDFPLIELPYQFAFSEQIDALFSAVHTKSTDHLQAIMQKQRYLFQYALKQGDMENPLELAVQLLGQSFAVVDVNGRVVYNLSNLSPKALLSGWPWLGQNQCSTMENDGGIRIPIMHADARFGHLLVIPSDWPILHEEIELYQQVANVFAAYHAMVKHSHVQAQYGVACIPASKLLDHIKRQQLPVLEGAYFSILISFPAEMNQEQTSQLDQLRIRLESSPHLKWLPWCAVLTSEGLFIMTPSRYGQKSREHELIGRISALAKTMDQEGIRLFISNTKVGLECLAESYAECKEMQKFADQIPMRLRVLRFDLKSYLPLFHHMTPEEMQAYCSSVFGELMQKSDDSQEMLDTLHAYLDNDCQVNATARQLYLHRNTLTYRLNKTSELLGLDLKKTDDLVRLKLGLVFMDMQRCC